MKISKIRYLNQNNFSKDVHDTKLGASPSALMFARQFSELARDLRSCFEVVENACDEVLSSNDLRNILKHALYCGNVLNEGTIRGDANGFALESLLLFANVKTTTNKNTDTPTLIRPPENLLEVVVDVADDSDTIEDKQMTRIRCAKI